MNTHKFINSNANTGALNLLLRDRSLVLTV